MRRSSHRQARFLQALLGLVAAFLVGHADAAGLCDRIQVRGLSYHFDRSKDYQEINPGLGCEWRSASNKWFAAVGAFDNSLGDLTADAMVGWLPWDAGRLCPWDFAPCRANVRLGAVAGAFYGYGEKFIPMPPVPTVRFEGRDVDTYAILAGEVVMVFASIRF